MQYFLCKLPITNIYVSKVQRLIREESELKSCLTRQKMSRLEQILGKELEHPQDLSITQTLLENKSSILFPCHNLFSVCRVSLKQVLQSYFLLTHSNCQNSNLSGPARQYCRAVLSGKVKNIENVQVKSQFLLN